MRNNLLKISIIIISGLLSLFYLSFFDKPDYELYDFVKSGFSSAEPDSNIVLIEINDSDVELLGGFPIKRSYYALLFNELSSAKNKVIGFEIFLSQKQTIQSVYNEILKKEISKNEIVIFPALIFDDSVSNKQSILRPEGFEHLGNIKFGHINFNNVYPIEVFNNNRISGKELLSFGALVFEEFSKTNLIEDRVYLNPAFDPSKIKTFGLIEFLKKGKDKNWVKKNFSNKIIIVGVTAQNIGNKISIGKKELPGIYLHVALVKNLINGNSLFKMNKLIWVFLIAAFISILLITLPEYKVSIYLLGSILLLQFFVIITSSIYIPLLSINLAIITNILVYSFYNYYSISDKIKEYKDENISLEKLLQIKEQELQNLKNEYGENSLSKSAFYREKISLLQNELENLKKIKSEDSEIKIFSNEPKTFNGIVYLSDKMQNVCDIILKAAPTNANILILGESGSGKELVARAIHDLSERRNNNFVAVNCAALSSSLLESELFGHVKGAFTNAISDKMGRFEIANEGTIFLDEIGETDDNFQAKLLRVIQSGEFSRVGEAKIRKTNARIIAATNKDLAEEVKNKKFREDLYYRLNVITIKVPPLRERKEDIEALANYFLLNESTELNFTKAVIDQLVDYNWKGNVRELESTVKRAAIFAKAEKRKTIHLKDLPEHLAKISKESKDSIIIKSLLEKELSHSAINETASELGLSRTVVSETLRGYVLENYVKANFHTENVFNELSEQLKVKLSKKLDTYLRNIKKDVEKHDDNSFEQLKLKLNSKYRNLPQKYHESLDEIIKYFMKDL